MKLTLAPEVSINLSSPEVVSDGLRVWLDGESGAGKSCASALIVGQLMDKKHQVVVLDACGEYVTLSDLATDTVLVGYDVPGSYPLAIESIPQYLEFISYRRSIFFNLASWAETHLDKLDAFIVPFLVGLSDLRKRQPSWTFLLIEEAQNFCPQTIAPGENPAKVRLIRGILTGGRKYGLNAGLATQRPALVDSTARSQCNLRVFLRLSHEPDFQAIRPYLPKDLTLDEMAHFQSGEAIIKSRWTGTERVQLDKPMVEPLNHTIHFGVRR